MPEQQQGGGDALPLLDRGPITYESAIAKDRDMIKELRRVPENNSLYEKLWSERHAIAAIARHHAGAGCDPRAEDQCTVAPTDEWLRGGFNVCIPVRLDTADGQKQLLFRCPLPYRLAESYYPGTIDEKVGAEVGAYVWIQEHCPDVRIPHLYGFGFSDGRQFTHSAHCPWYVRIARTLRRNLSGFLKCPVASPYISRRPIGTQFSSAYLLLERISPQTGQAVITTWPKYHKDPDRRERLFRGMARIILSLARVPQPRIGSFQFHNDGTISLTNRPLTSTVVLLENDGYPRTIMQNDTCQSTQLFVSNMLTFHDRCFLNNANATYDELECQADLAVKTMLRAVSHQFIRPESCTGPFLLQHTDLHGGNVFVDDEWNVTYVIDLEWLCALPAESISLPYWFTGRGVDQLTGEHLAEFDKIRQEFMSAFEDEERKTAACLPLSRIMKESWESGGTWFWFSVRSINAASSLVYSHLLPKFTKDIKTFRELMHRFWCPGAGDVVQAKLADYGEYEKELRKVFGKSAGPAPTGSSVPTEVSTATKDVAGDN